MFLNLRSGSLRRRWDKIKGCATATMLTNCHTVANKPTQIMTGCWTYGKEFLNLKPLWNTIEP